MRVMILSVDGSNYHRDCWIKPLQQVYDTVFISCRIMRKYYSAQALADYILDILKDGDFEYVFVYSDGMRTNLLPENFYPMVREMCKLITFHADDQPEKWFALNAAKDYRYQIVFTHSKEAAWRRYNGEYLQWGFNPEVHHKILGLKKDIDVVFIGLNKCKEISIGLLEDYYEDGYLRQKTLTSIYMFCKEKGYNFKLYGTGWNYHPVLCECDGGYISDEETIDVINRAKIVINIAFSMDNAATAFQTKLRHFEIGGCGSFQITNENPDLKELYGDSICFVKDDNELNSSIEYYLNHDEEREEKAKRAYDISMRDHTMQHRLREMFKKASERFKEPLKLSPSNGINVKDVKFSGRNDLKSFLETFSISDDKQYYHFYDDCFQLEDLNPTMLGLETGADVYFGESIVAIHDPSEQNTRITLRKSFPREALYLPAVIGDDHNSQEMKDKLINTELGDLKDNKAFLMNMIIKSSAVQRVLEAVISDKKLKGLQISQTKAIIGDYLFYTSDRYFDIHTNAIRKILEKRKEGKQIAFYGGRDSLAQMIVREIVDSGTTDNVCIVDKDIKGLNEMYGDLPYILSTKVLNGELKYDIIVIASQRAELEIWNLVDHLRDTTLILPLYDMNNKNWDLL